VDHFSFSKLLVNDLEKTATFYKAVCGLTELARVEAEIAGRGIKEIMFNATGVGAATFVLLKFVDTDKIYTDEVITGFVTDDLEAFVARAQQAGGKLLQPIKNMPEHGVQVAFVTDVEGHLLEVVKML
jgi:lactoylglutathione lyase